MRLSNIMDLLAEYVVLGAAIVLMLGVLFYVGYKLVYQKVLKGEKRLTGAQIFLGFVTVGYACVVFGAVFLSRGRFYGAADLHLFSSWREAWNDMGSGLFRNNILNILLFVPLGFLLPFYGNTFKKMHKVVLIGFLTTLIIECAQYVTKMGIFEVDDLFDNTLGVLLGYCIFGIGSSIRRKKPIFLAGYLLPFLILTATGFGMYVKYEHQELGNLSLEYNYKVNMKHVQVETEIELSEERESRPVYFAKTLSEPETRALAESIFEKLGVKLDEKEADIYDESALYYSENRKYSVWVNYLGGSYSYTDFSYFPEREAEETASDREDAEGQAETEEGADVEEQAETEENAVSREEIEAALRKLGIEVPEDVDFWKENNGFVFSADMLEKNGVLLNGRLACSDYWDGKLKDVRNYLVEYEAGNEKEVLSPKEAYQKILDGKFRYDTYNGKPERIVVEDVEISYALDSKGYYVPIYVFRGKINGQETEISVRAIP